MCYEQIVMQIVTTCDAEVLMITDNEAMFGFNVTVYCVKCIHNMSNIKSIQIYVLLFCPIAIMFYFSVLLQLFCPIANYFYSLLILKQEGGYYF